MSYGENWYPGFRHYYSKKEPHDHEVYATPLGGGQQRRALTSSPLEGAQKGLSEYTALSIPGISSPRSLDDEDRPTALDSARQKMSDQFTKAPLPTPNDTEGPGAAGPDSNSLTLQDCSDTFTLANEPMTASSSSPVTNRPDDRAMQDGERPTSSYHRSAFHPVATVLRSVAAMLKNLAHIVEEAANPLSDGTHP